MATRVSPPWTAEQVEQLNAYQQRGDWHPFTCRRRGESSHNERWGDVGTLRATDAGWVCDDCGYTQDWAFDWMFEMGAEWLR